MVVVLGVVCVVKVFFEIAGYVHLTFHRILWRLTFVNSYSFAFMAYQPFACSNITRFLSRLGCKSSIFFFCKKSCVNLCNSKKYLHPWLLLKMVLQEKSSSKVTTIFCLQEQKNTAGFLFRVLFCYLCSKSRDGMRQMSLGCVWNL